MKPVGHSLAHSRRGRFGTVAGVGGKWERISGSVLIVAKHSEESGEHKAESSEQRKGRNRKDTRKPEHAISAEESFKMKIFELKDKALNSEKGESLLGFRETGSHACYMIYGILKPKERFRSVKPGPGHEEIVLAAKGDLKVSGYFSTTLKEGSGFAIEGDRECFLENTGDHDATYVIAGGHSETVRH